MSPRLCKNEIPYYRDRWSLTDGPRTQKFDCISEFRFFLDFKCSQIQHQIPKQTGSSIKFYCQFRFFKWKSNSFSCENVNRWPRLEIEAKGKVSIRMTAFLRYRGKDLARSYYLMGRLNKFPLVPLVILPDFRGLDQILLVEHKIKRTPLKHLV